MRTCRSVLQLLIDARVSAASIHLQCTIQTCTCFLLIAAASRPCIPHHRWLVHGHPQHMVLNFRGSQHLRQRLVCSTISGKAICIRDIRARDQNPGVRDYEASLLRLLEKITNGCVVEINETGALCLPALTVGISVSAIDTSVVYSTDAASGTAS